MITHFIPGPSYDKVAIYRDSENPYLFYYINSEPKLQIDSKDGLPKFRLALFGRGIKKDDDEVQQGRLVMTVDLALTAQQEKEIRAKILNYLRSNYAKDVQQFYPNYRASRCDLSAVTIRPVEFTTGKVYFNVIEGKENKSTHETTPNLFGSCCATFADSYDAQNSQILYDLMKTRDNNLCVGDIMATVVYNLRYDAIVPFKAKASVDTSRIYTLFQDMKQTHAGANAKLYGCYYVPEVGYFYSNGVDLYASKESITNYLRNRCSISSNIKITIDDKSKTAAIGANYEQLLTEMVSTRAEDGICDQLFKQTEPISPQAVRTKYDVGNNSGGSDEQGNQKLGLYDVCYKLKNDAEISTSEHWGIEINKNTTCEVEVNPQGNLTLMLPVRVADMLVSKYDVSEAYFQKLKVPIHVSAANFEKDIAGIDVKVIYDDANGKKKTEVFNFDKDHADPQYFDVLMSHDSSGQLISKIGYQTRVTYNGYDVYDTKDQNAQYTPIKYLDGKGECIRIGYVDIHNLNVVCKANNVDWDLVDKIMVKFTYRDDPNREGAQKTIELTSSTQEEKWNCYMYKGNSNYTYEVRYYYKDKTESQPKIYKGSSREVIIDDELSGMCTAKFYVNFDQKAIKRVKVITKCQNKEYESDWFTQSDSWEWKFRLIEDKEKTYRYMYRYELSNGDGRTEPSEWSEPISIKPGVTESHEIKVDAKGQNVRINAKTMDWSQWLEVNVYLKYDDDKNNIHFEEDLITLDSGNNTYNTSIPIVDKSIRPTIQVTYVNYNGEVKESEIVAVPDSGLVILPNTAPPKS